MKKILLILIFLALPISLATVCGATEFYASQTGKTCSACHLDPRGGGALTAEGKAFQATLQGDSRAAHLPSLRKGGIFLVGYLHLLTAILWFGTILYVHLVLKPAYAAGGLPRGEVRVGVGSMAVMGITGAVLTWNRIDAIDTLLHTRFGLLLLVKIALYLVMVLSAAVVVLCIGPRLKGKKKGDGPAPIPGDLTEEELSWYDGKEGHPAFFGYDGRVYDATGSKLWRNGQHMGRHAAGMDLTAALEQAPHGPDKVTALNEVGRVLPAGSRKKRPLHERVFFAMAYMNLSIVFLIVLILALWRWG